MYLISLTSNNAGFKNVYFNKTGLSIILGDQVDTNPKAEKNTFNGVGKSLLIELIHFCLGAEPTSDFIDKLKDWSFSLKFELDEKIYTATRDVVLNSKIVLNDNTMDIKDFNTFMGNKCFDIPSDFNYLSFRSLLPLFIRRNKNSYNDYKDYLDLGRSSTYQILLYNAFLLGLNISLIKKKKELRDEEIKIKKLEKQIKQDPVLKSFFTGNKDVQLEKKNLQRKIEQLEKRIKDTKISEDYYDIKSKYVEDNNTTDIYIEELENSKFNDIDIFFRSMANNLYPNNTSGITVTNNEKPNTLRFNLEAHIEADSSDGIGSAKIFCYDTSILFKGCNHKIDFLFHDNRIFSDIDPRQIVDILKTMYNLTLEKNKQYIISLNRNQIDNIRMLAETHSELITLDEYKTIITDNICLILKDTQDADKLLGVKLDIKYF